MKEIIINQNNILNEEITVKRKVNNYIFIHNNKLLLKYHHNSYYFIHDEDLKNSYNKKLILVKKIYLDDYPLLGDKTLEIKNFYIIYADVMIDETKWLDIKYVLNILNENKFNNPRVQDITNEIIEVINYLLTTKS